MSRTPTTPKTPKTPATIDTTAHSAAKTCKTFGDAHSKLIFTSAINHDEYRNVAAQFHARLFLIVRGLTDDELRDIFTAALPPYLNSASTTEHRKAREIFEECQALVEDQIAVRIRAYAQMWLQSPRGSNYETRYGKAKWV